MVKFCIGAKLLGVASPHPAASPSHARTKPPPQPPIQHLMPCSAICGSQSNYGSAHSYIIFATTEQVSMGRHITIQYHGVVGSVGDWATLLGIDYYTLHSRLRLGWSVERALETPVHHKASGRRTHRATGSKEYRAWLAMRERCSCPRYWAYDRYGGRPTPIRVCERWQTSFEDFFLDVGPAPSPQHSLGRIDNDDNYEPGNVAWQLPVEQARNRAAPRRRQPSPNS